MSKFLFFWMIELSNYSGHHILRYYAVSFRKLSYAIWFQFKITKFSFFVHKCRFRDEYNLPKFILKYTEYVIFWNNKRIIWKFPIYNRYVDLYLNGSILFITIHLICYLEYLWAWKWNGDDLQTKYYMY